MARLQTLSNHLSGSKAGGFWISTCLIALGALASTASATRNLTAPPVIIPLNYVFNSTFDYTFPGRFVTPVQVGNPTQNLALKLDIESPDLQIRQDSPNLAASNKFKNLLFKNDSSSSFFWGEPANEVGWLGVGPSDNITIGSLSNFQTGWNRWNNTETINLTNEQRQEMYSFSIGGSFGVHGPQCPVDGKSWLTSVVIGGGIPFRTWGIYFDGGVDDASSTFLNGNSPSFEGMLLLGGYQPSMLGENLTAIANITFNNQLPNSPPGTNSPHLLQIDSLFINGQRSVVPTNTQESWYRISPESLFSNFSTRAAAATFAQAVGATARKDEATGRTTYLFRSCTDPEAGPTQNVEVVFPRFLSTEQDQQGKRIKIPAQSLKISKNNTCYLAWQEPWNPASTTSSIIPNRGTLGLSFLRNVYLHADYDGGIYSMAIRSTSPATSPNPRSVYPIPNPAKFVLDACWNREGTPTGKFVGGFEDNWKTFPMKFKQYYGVVIGPPWIARSGKVIPAATFALAFLIIPVVGGIVFLVGTLVGNNKGRRK